MSEPTQPRVRFESFGREIEVQRGATLLEAARKAGVPMGASCEGDGICGWCRIDVVAGAEHLGPMDPRERELLRVLGAEPQERIGCLATVEGPVAVATGYW